LIGKSSKKKITSHLKKLDEMVRIEKIKDRIFNQVIYFLQKIIEKDNLKMHTFIQGPPGTGKSEIAEIIADIYIGLDLADRKIYSHTSLLYGKYPCETSRKTQEFIDSIKGGILLLDNEGLLTRELLATASKNMTQKTCDFICILTGYKSDFIKYFESNPGLSKRFVNKYIIQKREINDIVKIYQAILKRTGWTFFEKNKDDLKWKGGDMDNLVHFSKIAYAKNRIFNPDENKKIITMDDFNLAFKMYNFIDKKSNGAPVMMYS